jgi:hypothetical protein
MKRETSVFGLLRKVGACAKGDAFHGAAFYMVSAQMPSKR